MSAIGHTPLHFGDGRHHDGRPVKLTVRDVSAWYGEKQALDGVTIDIYDRETTAFIGPSGCGKSTLLRSFNRINETIDGFRLTGEILLDGQDIFDPGIELDRFRARFGWVAQAPNPFPWSIHENVAYGALPKGKISEWIDSSI